MKILVTGAAGQLGHDVLLALKARGHEAIGSDVAAAAAVEGFAWAAMDITDGAAVLNTLEAHRPEAIIHCAAWTAVDAAEDEENRPVVHAVNARGTANLAQACRTIGARMLYISTDYVFDGQGEKPWQPEDVPQGALSVYGQTKLEGERAVQAALEEYFIVRIAWVFGPYGRNFVKTMLALSEKYPALRVVCDQIGTPTYTPDLARLLADMIVTDRYGVYHATNEGGYISWADFAREIFRQAGCDTQVTPVTTAEYGLSKAARPFNSRLDKEKLVRAGFEPLPAWQDALGRYLKVVRGEA